MRFYVVVFFATCVCAGAYPIRSILDDQQKEKLHELGHICALGSGLKSYDLGLLKSASVPAQKLTKTAKCVVEQLIRHQDDGTIREILLRLKQAILSSLPKVISNAAILCNNLLGSTACNEVTKIVDLAMGNPQLKQIFALMDEKLRNR